MVALSLWAIRYAARRWMGLLGVLSVMLFSTVFEALKPWPAKILIDNVLNGQSMSNGLARAVHWLPGSSHPDYLLVWCVAATLVLFLLGWAVGVLSAFANIAFGQRMMYDLASELFAHLQRLSLRFHARKSVGDLIRRVTTDCSCVSTIVKDALLPVLSSTFSLVFMFVIMWRMSPWLTLLSLAVLPYMVFVFRRFSERMMQFSYAQQEADGRIYEVVEQTLSAIPIVQAFGRERDADARFQGCTTATLSATLAATRVQMQFKILMGLSTAAGTAGILWVGARQALNGSLTVGQMLVFLSYLGSLYGPLQSLMYTSSTLQGAAGSAKRVLEVLAHDHEVSDRPGAMPLPPSRGHVRLENVVFGYHEDRPVLHGVSLEALPGQTIAVVGPTGAGKSTLLSLVPRFFDPWEGRVTLDGHDLRDVTLKTLRNQIAVVLQEPFLFPLTIAENIAYGRLDAARDQIEAAAKAANAHQFIEKLPEGYDTRVGERGATFSGGERQRLSIARALLKDAPVLILDEPTSALDAETEGLLLEALDRLTAGRTTLIIAHRLSTIRNASRIVVLEDGRISDSGTHAELIERGGLYSRLCEIQFGGAAARHSPNVADGEAVLAPAQGRDA
jgi:ATP-binding cassette subfamily B protein/subfamily B ATP-binding cassette protein MsbA